MKKRSIGTVLLVLCYIPLLLLAQTGGRSGGGSFERSQPERDSSPIERDTSPTYTDDGSPAEPVNLGPIETIVIVVFLVTAGVLAKNPQLLQHITSLNSLSSLSVDVNTDRVTVSKIQIVLYATARSVQREIRQLSEVGDFNTKEGLRHFLREVLIVLQRHSDTWCYALGQSEALHRSRAIDRFDDLSTTERMKFDAETFSRIANQRTIQKTYQNSEEVPEFIVVTLLIGTEHDSPLFAPIKTIEDVKAALFACLGITATHLLKVELLWTPESDRDSLTKDDLIAKYTDLVAL